MPIADLPDPNWKVRGFHVRYKESHSKELKNEQIYMAESNPKRPRNLSSNLTEEQRPVLDQFVHQLKENMNRNHQRESLATLGSLQQFRNTYF